jgi:hypothetical protein
MAAPDLPAGSPEVTFLCRRGFDVVTVFDFFGEGASASVEG